jgi:hypothetical protein
MNTKNEDTIYSINPMLTMKTILETEEKTRELISALYTDCERRFVNALILFEKIYDDQTKDLNQQQYTQLQKENVTNAPRNQVAVALEDEVELEEPLYNSALYVNKPLPLPENYKEPEANQAQEKEDELYSASYDQTYGQSKEQKMKDNLLDTGLDKPLDTVKPEEKDKSWISGITDTLNQFSAPSFMAKEDKPVQEKEPQKDTFGLETGDFGKTQPEPVEPAEKDMFGFPKKVEPAEKDMFGKTQPEPVEPTEKDMFGFPKTVEPVEKDMFGFPKTVEPIVNTNKNKNKNTNTNIVLKPLNLPRVDNPSQPYDTNNSENTNRREPLPVPRPVPLPVPLPVENTLKKNTNQAPNQPGPRIPETRIPETRIPETRNTDARIPETRIPETRIPETRIPETRIPETRNTDARNRDERNLNARKPEKKEENRRNVARNMFGEPDLS